MNNITSKGIENQFMTFSEAKTKFIKVLNKEIEKVHIDLQEVFNAYSNKKRNAYEQNIYLSFDFTNTIDKKNRLSKLFSVINNLNKLDTIAYTTQSIDKSPKIERFVYFKKNENFILNFNMNEKEIKEVNKKNKDLTKFHWGEKETIKYSVIVTMGEILINFNKDNNKDNSHIKFYNLLFSILNNKQQTAKYTKLIFGKAPKHEINKN